MRTKNLRASSVTSESLRARVLAASVELIEKNGLEGLSLREAARLANVSHQAPYHYFADREALLAAICESGFTMLGEKVREARGTGTGPGDKLERAIISYIDFAVEHPAHFRVMFRPELVRLEQHAGAQKAADAAFAHVPAMIAEAMQDGLPAEPSVEALTAAVWSFAHGYACLLLDGPLEMMLPSVAANRRKATRDAVRALGSLLEAAIAVGRRNRAPPKNRPRGTQKRHDSKPRDNAEGRPSIPGSRQDAVRASRPRESKR